MEISFNKKDSFLKENKNITNDLIMEVLVSVSNELKKEGYTTAHKYTGEAEEAISDALDPLDISKIPEIVVFGIKVIFSDVPFN